MGMEKRYFHVLFCFPVLLLRKGEIRMDSVDRSILACLSENARQSATEISHKVHLSIAAVIERIRKISTKWEMMCPR